MTFIGQSYGERPATVERLRAEGIDVRCWGFGWPEGRIEHDEMVRVFGASRINLNLSSAFSPPRRLPLRVAPPDRRKSRRSARARSRAGPSRCRAAAASCSPTASPHLEDYLTPGREIGVFESPDELVGQVRWWLEHEDERARAAEAGYRRVRAEHTYDHRFAEIFERVGLG